MIATTMLPLVGGMARSITSKSPSQMPASRNELPLARARNVLSGLRIRYSFKLGGHSTQSSSGDAKIASTGVAGNGQPVPGGGSAVWTGR